MPQANLMDTILQLRISLPQYAGLCQLTRTKQWGVQYLEGTDGKTYSTLGSVCQEGFLGKGRTPQSENCEGPSTIHAHLYGRDAENIVGEPPALSFSQWTTGGILIKCRCLNSQLRIFHQIHIALFLMLLQKCSYISIISN